MTHGYFVLTTLVAVVDCSHGLSLQAPAKLAGCEYDVPNTLL
jgi:hypothetical protein